MTTFNSLDTPHDKLLKYIIKPVGVIHIEHKVSLLGQKIFNILLAHAFHNLQTQVQHTITVKALLKYIPAAGNVTHLRKTLKEMCIPVDFNIFDKDKDEWGFFALLPEAVIKKGESVCKYSFTPNMIELMADPSKMMYAKLSILIQQKYTASKYGWFLYELCFDYKNVPGGGKTPKLPLKDLRKFFGIEPHQYLKYKSLNQHVLKNALADMNRVTELIVTSKEYKIGRKVTHIQYFVTTKENEKPLLNVTEEYPQNSITSTLEDLGISPTVITLMTAKYNEHIKESILVFKEEIKRKGVDFPDRLIMKILENVKKGWTSKATERQRLSIISLEDDKKEVKAKAEEEQNKKNEFAKATNQDKFTMLQYDQQPALQDNYKGLNEEQEKEFICNIFSLFTAGKSFDEVNMVWSEKLFKVMK